MTKKEKDQYKSDAIAYLKKVLKPGSNCYTTLNGVSSSGMRRYISVVIPCTITKFDKKKLGIMNITHYVANACGLRLHRNKGLIVDGCGMDMGFHIVYNLGRTLFPNGGSLKDTNVIRRHQEEGRGKEIDGGYLLNHDWV